MASRRVRLTWLDCKEYAYKKCKPGEFVHNNTKPLFRIAWHFPTNTKYSGEVSLISFRYIEISLYAQARQSLLLSTQGNIYIRLRFLNKYFTFLEELNELFRET